jgi:hypothetical protein
MGRTEKDDLSAAQILYPCMQCADIFFLKVGFALFLLLTTTSDSLVVNDAVKMCFNVCRQILQSLKTISVVFEIVEEQYNGTEVTKSMA